MEMIINAGGFGLSIPKMVTAVSLWSYVIVAIRKYDGDPNMAIYSIHDPVCVGGKQGAFIFTKLKTGWFPVDLTKENSWLLNSDFLTNNVVEIFLDGTSARGERIGVGETKLTFTVYDKKYKQARKVFSRCCIEASGVQVAALSIKGEMIFRPDHQRLKRFIK